MKKRKTMIIVLLVSVMTLTSYYNSILAQDSNLDFDWKGPYYENLAPVLVNGKYGYVDLNNNFVIQPKYWGASDFSQGLALVCQEESDHSEGIVYIDKKGKIVKTFLDVLAENSTKEVLLMKDYYSVIANPGLQMRNRPSLEGERVMLIPFGEKIKVLRKTDLPMKAEGLDGFWYLVEYEGKQGYVFSGFLSRISIKDFYKNYFSKMFGKFTPTVRMYLGIDREGYFYIDPSGIIFIFKGVLGTDNTVAQMYIPHLSLAEAFWFIKNYMPDLMVLKIGEVEVRTQFKNLDYPVNDGRILLRVENNIEETDLIIEQDKFGYVRIIY